MWVSLECTAHDLFFKMKFAHYAARHTRNSHAGRQTRTQAGAQGCRFLVFFFRGGAINLHPIQRRPAAAEHSTQITVTQQPGRKQQQQQQNPGTTTRQQTGIYLGWQQKGLTHSTVEVGRHTHICRSHCESQSPSGCIDICHHTATPRSPGMRGQDERWRYDALARGTGEQSFFFIIIIIAWKALFQTKL